MKLVASIHPISLICRCSNGLKVISMIIAHLDSKSSTPLHSISNPTNWTIHMNQWTHVWINQRHVHIQLQQHVFQLITRQNETKLISFLNHWMSILVTPVWLSCHFPDDAVFFHINLMIERKRERERQRAGCVVCCCASDFSDVWSRQSKYLYDCLQTDKRALVRPQTNNETKINIERRVPHSRHSYVQTNVVVTNVVDTNGEDERTRE